MHNRIFQIRLNLFVIIPTLLVGCTSPSVHISGYEPWEYTCQQSKVNTAFTRNYMNALSPRIVEELKTDWSFFYSPDFKEKQDFLMPQFNDKAWQAVSIPHTWMTYETTQELHPFIKYASEDEDAYWWKGWGYYRKQLVIDSSLKDKKFFIEFDGVQKYCQLYVNGKKVGEHKGGFNSFSMDITNYIDWAVDMQTIAVSVNGYRRDKWQIPPMTAGNWNVYSGIYRPVRLMVKNNIHIPYQGNSEHEGGTFITTPFVRNDSTIVEIKTFVKNDTPNTELITLRTVITDKDENVLAEIKSTKSLPKGQIAEYQQKSPILKGLERWSHENPVLYKVHSYIYRNRELTDYYQSPLGIRTFHWDYQTNHLFVNGKKINLKGTNRHQEYPWLGDAIPEWITIKDMEDIRYGMGINFMRTAHYPQASIVYDFNNQNGIITVEEVPNIKNINFSKEVQEQNVRAMIRRDRNNPSIFFWSVGNETSDAANSKWVVEEDQTRIIHARKAENAGDYVAHTHINLDMENLLRVTHRGWNTPEDAPPAIDPTPENGQEAGCDLWQYKQAKIPNASIRGDLNSNCVAWIYQDHGADRKYKNSILLNTNAKGWVDMYRIPKSVYHLTRANYLKEPVLHIQPFYWKKKFIGQQKAVYVDSNCDEVELLVNGQSKGIEKIQRNKYNSVVFENITVTNGSLTAIGYRNGERIISQTYKMPGKPYRIVLKASADTIKGYHEGIAIITAYIVDKEGNIVPDANPDIVWEVNGEAKLVGPIQYKTDLTNSESMTGTGYETAPVSNVIRASNQPGKIKVKVCSPGLKHGNMELMNQPDKKSDKLIKQPLLHLAGRKAVIRDINYTPEFTFTNYITKRLYDNVSFDIQNTADLKNQILSFLDEEGDINILQGFGFNVLIEQLESVVRRMDGLLIGDDFNFLMQQYNVYLNLEHLIDNKMFHVDYANLLKEKYLKQILIQHQQLDYDTISEEIMSYPTKSKICYIQLNNLPNKSPELRYDYVTRTYTLITTVKDLYNDISIAFNLKEAPIKTWCEIARITPGLIFNPATFQISFEHKKHIIVIPKQA